MPLQAGARLGSCEVVASIGAGGMGEVYRARDTRLQRDVAIKVLPEMFAADPERLSRFEREAHLLAALNHPHIAHIYGLEGRERRDGQDERSAPFIVMEFVDGLTLAERLAHGRMPVDEALPIARQIADALEAAHEQGIIHRDLKPANIKIKGDGTVKVLDFGLAKALDGSAVSGRPGGVGGLSMSPTMISPAQMTHVGIILGTAAYMAPEQAKGRPVDKRGDIWAFGCVLFEMLTGGAAFAGESVSETLASVMRDAPPLDALPSDTPRHVRQLMARCFERDPRQRLRDIGEARILLNAVDEAAEAPPATARRSPHMLVTAVAAGAMAAAIAGAVAWRLKPAPAPPLRKFALSLTTPFAELSPDGGRIAYVEADHLLVRDLAAAEPRDLGAMSPDLNGIGWSPDGATIVTTSRDGKIRTIPARGGAPLVVCEIPESHQAIGTAWMGNDLVFAAWRGSLYRVDARGGTPKRWLATDPQKEIDFHGLAALPDGRVVFAAHQQNNEYTVETFDGVTRAKLLPSIAPASIEAFGTVGQFWYSATGHLLFTRFDANAGLWALPFGRGALDAKQAFLVAPHVTNASVANDGTLLILTGSDAAVSFELTAVDRSGQSARVVGAPAAAIESPTVSPDGKRVAMVMRAGNRRQVWVQDIGGTAGTRLTFEDEDFAHPAWFPAGDRLLYSGHAQLIRGAQVFAVAGDGSGKAQPLGFAHRAEASTDGKEVVYLVDENGANHLRRGKLESGAKLERVFTTDPEPDVRNFAFSPDGRLLAYVDYRAGRADLLITRYPTTEGRWQVFGNGGRALWGSDDSLRWARGTHELFFIVSGSEPEGGRMMAADVRATDGVTVGRPVGLFDVSADGLAGGFDVSPDGKAFYIRRRASSQPKGPGRRYTLVQDWPAEFAR